MKFTARRQVINDAFMPAGLHAEFAAIAERADRKHSGYVTVDVALPHRPRTTGPKSQNHHINSHVQDIAAATGASFDAVKMHLKRLAVDSGYPFDTLPDGSVAPKSEADASVEEASLLIEAAHLFAGEWGIRLKESDE